jgi:pimeloyl-ACP methyl ester carboxylesterase
MTELGFRDTLLADGRRIGVLRHEGEGPTVFLVHGAGANAEIWRPLLKPLSAFDLWAPSLPGRDGSDGPPIASARELGAWLAAVVRASGRPGAVVVGHSLGGAIAQELAHHAPDLVEGLVLVASGAKLRVHPTILEQAERATQGGEAMSGRLGFPADAAPEAVDPYVEASAATPPEATLADWRACDGFDRMADVPALAVPTLVVHGADDALTPPKFQRFFEDALPRGSRVELEGVGHMVPWEAPKAFARTLRSWIAGIGDGRGAR